MPSKKPANKANENSAKLSSRTTQPELIELFLQDNGWEFKVKFEALLKTILTPNLGPNEGHEKLHEGTKYVFQSPGFFSYFILGAASTLPNTELMQKFGIKAIYVRSKIVDGTIPTLELCFVKGDQSGASRAELRLISFNQFVGTEVEGVSKAEKTVIKENKYQMDTGLIALLKENGIEIESERIHCKELLIGVNLGDRFSVKHYKPMNLKTTSTSPAGEAFFRLESTTGVKFEDNFNNFLSKNKMSDKLGLVERMLKNILEPIRRTSYSPESSSLSQTDRRKAYQAFLAGAVEMNFKNQYGINAKTSVVVGRDYADFVFVLEGIPILVKFGEEESGAVLNKMKALGYAVAPLQLDPVLSPRLLCAIGFGGTDPLSVKGDTVARASPPQNFFVNENNFHESLTSFKKGDSLEHLKRELKDRIRKQHLSMPDFMMQGGGEDIKKYDTYLSRLLTGELLSMSFDGIEKKIFLYEDEGEARKLTSFVFISEENGKKKVLFFNILEGDGKEGRELLEKWIYLNELAPGSKCRVINIIVDPMAAKRGVDSYLKDDNIILRDDVDYFRGISDASKQHRGMLVSAAIAAKPETFIQQLRAGKTSDISKPFDTLMKKLVDGKLSSIIYSESNLQAFLQGFLVGIKDTIVIPELRITPAGQSDLAIISLKGESSPPPILIELKFLPNYAQNEKSADELLKDATKQVEKVKDIKCLTQGDTARRIAIVFVQGQSLGHSVVKDVFKISLASEASISDSSETKTHSLFKAIYDDNIEPLRKAEKADFTRRDDNDDPLLHAAIKKYQFETEAKNHPKQWAIVKFILDVDTVDVNVLNKEGLSALHLAVDGEAWGEHRGKKAQHDLMEKLLLKKDINVDIKASETDFTPLFYLTDDVDEKALNLLLGKDADVSIMDQLGRLPLHYVKGEKIVALLIKADADSINAQDNQHVTPLDRAVQNKEVPTATVRILIENGAYIDLKGGHDKKTTRQLAEKAGGSSDTIELLNTIEDFFRDPISIITAARHSTIFGEERISVDPILFKVKNSSGKTVLHIIAEEGNRPLNLKRLLRHSEHLDIDALDSQGRTALMLAAAKGLDKNVELLLQKTNLKSKDNSGRDAIGLAEQGEHLSTVIQLLKAEGASLDVQQFVDPDQIKIPFLKVMVQLFCLIEKKTESDLEELIKIKDVEDSTQRHLIFSTKMHEGEKRAFTLMQKAIQHHQLDLVKAFVGLGVVVSGELVRFAENSQSKQQNRVYLFLNNLNELWKGVASGKVDAELLARLLPNFPALRSLKDQHGETLIQRYLKSETVSLDTIKLLVGHGFYMDIDAALLNQVTQKYPSLKSYLEMIIKLSSQIETFEAYEIEKLLSPKLLKDNPEIRFIRSKGGKTLLHCYASKANSFFSSDKSYVDMVTLVEQGLPFDVLDRNRNSPLHAAKQGEPASKLLQALDSAFNSLRRMLGARELLTLDNLKNLFIEARVPLESTLNVLDLLPLAEDSEFRRVFDYAVLLQADKASLQYLVSQQNTPFGTQENLFDYDGRSVSPIHVVATHYASDTPSDNKKTVAVLNYLIKELGFDPNRLDGEDMSPLDRLVQQENPDPLRVLNLLENGATVESIEISRMKHQTGAKIILEFLKKIFGDIDKIGEGEGHVDISRYKTNFQRAFNQLKGNKFDSQFSEKAFNDLLTASLQYMERKDRPNVTLMMEFMAHGANIDYPSVSSEQTPGRMFVNLFRKMFTEVVEKKNINIFDRREKILILVSSKDSSDRFIFSGLIIPGDTIINALLKVTMSGATSLDWFIREGGPIETLDTLVKTRVYYNTPGKVINLDPFLRLAIVQEIKNIPIIVTLLGHGLSIEVLQDGLGDESVKAIVDSLKSVFEKVARGDSVDISVFADTLNESLRQASMDRLLQMFVKATWNGQTVLHAFVQKGGSTDTLDSLIRIGADVNAKDAKGLMPLQYLLKQDYPDVDVLLRLLNQGAAIMSFKITDDGVLVIKSLSDDGIKNKAIKILLTNIDAYVQLLRNRKPDRIKFLESTEEKLDELANSDTKYKEYIGTLKKKLDIDVFVKVQGPLGFTTLFVASQEGNGAAMDDILTVQVNVNARNSQGSTPLHFTVAYSSELSMKLLMKGAYFDARNGREIRPDMVEACTSENKELFKRINKLFAAGLMGGKADFEAAWKQLKQLMPAADDILKLYSEGGATLAHRIFKNPMLDVPLYFINLPEIKVTINVPDSAGLTLLHMAAGLRVDDPEGSLQLVEDLLKAGAYFDIDSYGGETPMDVAPLGGRVRGLLEHIAAVWLSTSDEDFMIFVGHLQALKEFMSITDILNLRAVGGRPTLAQQVVKESRDLGVIEYFFSHTDITPVMIGTKDAEGNSAWSYAEAEPEKLQTLKKIMLRKLGRSSAPGLEVQAPVPLEAEAKGLETKTEEKENVEGATKSKTKKPRRKKKKASTSSPEKIESQHSQQQAYVQIDKAIKNKYPQIHLQAVKQGLYIPSFEKRKVEIEGLCTVITRGYLQSLFLGQQEIFLRNLEVSAELSERMALGQSLSDREDLELKSFENLMNKFQKEVDFPEEHSLPSKLSPTQSVKQLGDLSHYISHLEGEFVIHLVTGNHVVAIARLKNTQNKYVYFDSNVGLATDITDVKQLMFVLEQGVKKAGYDVSAEGLLVEHFDVRKANDELSKAEKDILTKPISTERELLVLQDEQSPLELEGGKKINRETLYDMGAKLQLEGDATRLVNAEMSQGDWVTGLQSGKITINARDYVQTLIQTLKKTSKETIQELVSVSSGIALEGTAREIKRVNELHRELNKPVKTLKTHELNSLLTDASDTSLRKLDFQQGADKPKHEAPSNFVSSTAKVLMLKGMLDTVRALMADDRTGFLLGAGEIIYSRYISGPLENIFSKPPPKRMKKLRTTAKYLKKGTASAIVGSPFDTVDFITALKALKRAKPGTVEFDIALAQTIISGISISNNVIMVFVPAVGAVIMVVTSVAQVMVVPAAVATHFTKKYGLTLEETIETFGRLFVGLGLSEKMLFLSISKDSLYERFEKAIKLKERMGKHVRVYGMGLGETRVVTTKQSNGVVVFEDAYIDPGVAHINMSVPLSAFSDHDWYDFPKKTVTLNEVSFFSPKGTFLYPVYASPLPAMEVIRSRRRQNVIGYHVTPALYKEIPRTFTGLVFNAYKNDLFCLPSCPSSEKNTDNYGSSCALPNRGKAVTRRGYLHDKALYTDCKNAIVLGDKNLSCKEGDKIVIDMEHISHGKVAVVGPCTAEFYLNQHSKVQVFGGDNSPKNLFTLLNPCFSGDIFGGKNSINIFDTHKVKLDRLLYRDQLITYTGYCEYIVKTEDGEIDHDRSINRTVTNSVSTEKITYFIGHENRLDTIRCSHEDPDDKDMWVDGMGYRGDDGRSDEIEECQQVVVRGGTTVFGKVGSYIFSVMPNPPGVASIKVLGEGQVFFPDSVLPDMKNIRYHNATNVLSLTLVSSHTPEASLELDIHGYLDIDTKAPRFTLADKFDTFIYPTIHFDLEENQDSHDIHSFKLFAVMRLDQPEERAWIESDSRLNSLRKESERLGKDEIHPVLNYWKSLSLDGLEKQLASLENQEEYLEYWDSNFADRPETEDRTQRREGFQKKLKLVREKIIAARESKEKLPQAPKKIKEAEDLQREIAHEIEKAERIRGKTKASWEEKKSAVQLDETMQQKLEQAWLTETQCKQLEKTDHVLLDLRDTEDKWINAEKLEAEADKALLEAKLRQVSNFDTSATRKLIAILNDRTQDYDDLTNEITRLKSFPNYRTWQTMEMEASIAKQESIDAIATALKPKQELLAKKIGLIEQFKRSFFSSLLKKEIRELEGSVVLLREKINGLEGVSALLESSVEEAYLSYHMRSERRDYFNEHYRLISKHRGHDQLLLEAETNRGMQRYKSLWGSTSSDLLALNFVEYAQGGENRDLYNAAMLNKTEAGFVMLNNYAKDKELDILMLVDMPRQIQARGCDLLLDSPPLYIDLKDYYLSDEHRHLAFMLHDSIGQPLIVPAMDEGFICQRGNLSEIVQVQPIPFYPVSHSEPVYRIAAAGIEQNASMIAIDAALNLTSFYRDGSYLIVIGSDRQGRSSRLFLEEFYHREQPLNLYFSVENYVLNLIEAGKLAISYQQIEQYAEDEYARTTQIYFVDLTSESSTINHNEQLEPHSTTSPKKGVLEIQGVRPSDIKVKLSGNGHTLLLESISTHNSIQLSHWDRPEHRITYVVFDELSDRRTALVKLDKLFPSAIHIEELDLTQIAKIQSLFYRASVNDFFEKKVTSLDLIVDSLCDFIRVSALCLDSEKVITSTEKDELSYNWKTLQQLCSDYPDKGAEALLWLLAKAYFQVGPGLSTQYFSALEVEGLLEDMKVFLPYGGALSPPSLNYIESFLNTAFIKGKAAAILAKAFHVTQATSTQSDILARAERAVDEADGSNDEDALDFVHEEQHKPLSSGTAKLSSWFSPVISNGVSYITAGVRSINGFFSSKKVDSEDLEGHSYRLTQDDIDDGVEVEEEDSGYLDYADQQVPEFQGSHLHNGEYDPGISPTESIGSESTFNYGFERISEQYTGLLGDAGMQATKEALFHYITRGNATRTAHKRWSNLNAALNTQTSTVVCNKYMEFEQFVEATISPLSELRQSEINDEVREKLCPEMIGSFIRSYQEAGFKKLENDLGEWKIRFITQILSKAERNRVSAEPANSRFLDIPLERYLIAKKATQGKASCFFSDSSGIKQSEASNKNMEWSRVYNG